MATTITANGINFPDGSASAPSIGGTDTNTGLFTGSDIVGFATGGTERLRITSDGKIGVAEASPDHIFHIKGSTPILAVESSSWTSGVSAALRLSYTDGNAREIRGHYDHGLQFFLNPGEVMRINTSGKIRVGSGDPVYNFEVQNSGFVETLVGSTNASGAGIILDGDSNGDGSGGDYAQIFHQNDGTLNFRARNGSGGTDTIFLSGTSEKLRILSNGDIGFGIAAPTTQSGRVLHLHAGAAQQRFHMTNNTTGSGASDGFEIIVEQSANVRIRNFEAGDLMFDTGGSNNEAMRITSAGKVGVNTLSPTQARFVVQQDSGNTAALIKANTGASLALGGVSQPRILLEAAASASDYIIYTAGGSSWGSAGWQERLRISSSGKILLGTTRTYYSGEYYDDITINNSGGSGSTGGCGITMLSSSDSWGAIQFGDSNDDDVGYIKYDHNSNHMRFGINAGIRARLDADGLKFGTDSATANGLDDYEEGTFTPSFWASSTAFTTAPTYTNRSAHYTKIGRQVTFNIYLSWNTAGAGGAGNVYLGGLPFDQASNVVYAGIYWGWWDFNSTAMDSDEVMTGYINNNSANVVMGKSHVGAAGTFVPLNAYYAINGKSGNFQMNGVYYTS